MRIAVIDMGTNTFHLIIVEVQGYQFRTIYREKTAVKIGEKGINKGLITEEAKSRAMEALTTFKKVTEEYKISNIYATATSAIRNARNGQELVSEIQQRLNIDTQIISGHREAELIYFGVKKALLIGEEPVLIMDIGGGSIEFVVGTHEQILWRESFEIGGQRMVEKFHKDDPIAPSDIDNLLKYLHEQLEPLREVCSTFQPKTLIGSSGTFDTLSEIYQLRSGIGIDEKETELPLTIEAFQAIQKELINKNRAERLAIPGMIPLRVDMIVVAVLLVKYVIDTIGIEHIRVSAYALKEGVLLHTIDMLNAENPLKS
ncbi:MAG: exopolyphosphatase [Cyclobacteriaceae bacterium]|nr:exopolyphosphatase [Cyclobacteriaceae bacterium HetDA_MAG_MS6]